MLFSSITFLYYFLPITLLAYLLAPRRLKNVVLLASSLIFYGWGEKLLVILFIISIIVGWAVGMMMEKVKEDRVRKGLLLFVILYDLGLLGYFKYSDFFIQSFNDVTGAGIPLLHVALPIGISFYTFQLLSYNIDVYRRTVPAQKNLIHLGAYVSMFPQLIAGPIVRYADVRESLEERTHSLEMTASGIERFMVGLGKKVLIANVIGEICVAYRQTAQPSVLFFWLYAISYTLQIYFDFSGYSDMAIGLGRIFGFRFMENFNYPYISGSITEFWRRWHISLGSWFRDYVYIPLGGNRKGIKRQLFNILVVWMLTGLWHGAAWNFVLWGVLYAILLTIEKLGLLKWLNKHRIAGHIYTLTCVVIGFLIFNAGSFSQALGDILGLFSFGRYPLTSAESLYLLKSNGLLILAGILGATPIPCMLLGKIKENSKAEAAADLLEPVVLVILLLLVTAYLVDGSFNPFLYFRF